MNTNIGKKVLIRGNRSGVEFGELVSQNGSEVTLKNARRIWYWDGAASLSQLAKDGTSNPSSCKFTVSVDSITILDTIKRAKNYREPTICRIYGSKKNCVEVILPILNFSDKDIENFIIKYNIKLHPLYYNADGSLNIKKD